MKEREKSHKEREAELETSHRERERELKEEIASLREKVRQDPVCGQY